MREYRKANPKYRDRTNYLRQWRREHTDKDIVYHRDKRALADFIIRAAKSEGCIDCGETDPIVLEFDHIKDKKVAEIGYLRPRAKLSQLINEIAKCEIRCANCHRRVTAKRRAATVS